MKKVMALILALVLVLSLAACGGSGEKKENTAETTKAEITTDCLLGEWIGNKNEMGYYNGYEEIYVIKIIKGGIAKFYRTEEYYKNQFDSGSDITWEIKDDCVVFTERYNGEIWGIHSFEIIDENTLKNAENGAEYKKQ